MYKKLFTIVVAAILSSPGYAAEKEVNNATSNKQTIYGLYEKVLILPGNFPFEAKMDTGAQTSSMDAHDIKRFEKNDEKWVRFNVTSIDENNNPRTATYERKLVRVVKLKGAGGKDKRPSVLMNVCLGNQVYEEEFTLRDRGEMKYPVLIGQKTIKHLGLIDVNRQFTIEPQCQSK